MPVQKEKDQRPNILYSCYSRTSRDGEHFVPEHIFGYTLAGSSETYLDGNTYVFKEGDFRFFRRNQLAKYAKYPPANGGEYRSISIAIDQETLRSISEEYNLHMTMPYTGRNVLHLQPNVLFTNFINSLEPYLHSTGQLGEALVKLKVKEIVMILLQTNPELKDVLFDFSEPGKIDLEAFMNKNYKFNVDISRFAYLTGRSLATFKRDFEKIYHTSPSKWLQQKRLEDAYYLIKEKGWRSSDVYMEVGFKDFSHFSFAFRKVYGVAPSKLA